MFRVGGSDFDVDVFLEGGGLEPDSVWRKGAQRFEHSVTNTDLNQSSGMRFVASDADMSDLASQIEETGDFIREYQGELLGLTSMPGVEFAVFDFGCAIRPPGWSSFTFPPALLTLAGAVGASLCVSVYPTSDDEDEDGDEDENGDKDKDDNG
ncbi:MAG: hypothetical protein V4857_12115 [Pseudomonadota bacterium]